MTTSTDGGAAAIRPRVATRGVRVPPQGEGGFDVTWYPVCLSSAVRPGDVKGLDFLDGRVVVFRGDNGVVTVMSAYCRHFGADLSGGKVIGNQLRCPYHHWQYGQDGACKHIPIGGPIPKKARQFVFPTVEKWGIVFAFNGDSPTFELPDFPYPSETLRYRAFGTIPCKLDIALQATNNVDFQHLIVLHGLDIEEYPDVKFHEYGLSQRGLVWRDNLRGAGARSTVDVVLAGTNILMFGGDLAGITASMAISGTPLTRRGISEVYTVVAAPTSQGGPEAEEATQTMLSNLERWAHALMIEDDLPITNNISFRIDNALRQDRYVARMVRYLQTYPRAHPSADFIK